MTFSLASLRNLAVNPSIPQDLLLLSVPKKIRLWHSPLGGDKKWGGGGGTW